MNQEQRDLKPGDVVAQRNERGGWSAVKILEIDPWPDGTFCAHCMVYEETASRPAAETLHELMVLVGHAPIDAGSFAEWEIIAHQAVTPEELVDFHGYLKQTDFRRYIDATGQDADDILDRSREHYNRAYYLGDEGKHLEAIEEYNQAIDIYPLYCWAIDNRGLTYMHLRKYEIALGDFEESLAINPDGWLAFFSKGECLLRLGRLAEAEIVFSEGRERFPEQDAKFTEFLGITRAKQTMG